MAFDFKKEYRDLYLPKAKPSIVEVPRMRFIAVHGEGDPNEEVYMNSLKPDYIAEKALMFLFNEQNLVSEDLLIRIVNDLELDRAYMARVLADNRRPVELDQGLLF